MPDQLVGRAPVAVVMLAALIGCSSAPIESAQPAPAAGPEPSPPPQRPEPDPGPPPEPDPDPPPEAEPEPTPDPCVLALDAAGQVLAGEEPELPQPWEVVYVEGRDEELEAELGWHPWGELHGFTITVWPDVHPSPDTVSFTVVHELGHLIDRRCLDWDEGETWMAERGLDGRWMTDDPYASPHEDFADSFAVCVGGDPRWWTMAGTPPGDEACQVLLALVQP